MRGKAAVVVAVLGLATFSVYAGKPPMFKPWMSDSWSWQQKQLANHALDVLFDTCPAIGRYLQHDIQSANVYMERMDKPIDAQFAPPFWKAHGWSKVLRLDLVTIPTPSNPVLAHDAGKAGVDLNFYMGTGSNAGIYFESDQKGLCGASHSVAVRRSGDPALHISDYADTFVPAPALKMLDNF